jgi:hypothetical protein
MTSSGPPLTARHFISYPFSQGPIKQGGRRVSHGVAMAVGDGEVERMVGRDAASAAVRGGAACDAGEREAEVGQGPGA